MRVRVTGVTGKAQAVSVNHYEITWESPVIVEIFASRFIYKCHRNYLQMSDQASEILRRIASAEEIVNVAVVHEAA